MRRSHPKLRFDFVKDLAPVTPLTGLPLILAVHPTLGVSSFKELIALAKSKPGELHLRVGRAWGRCRISPAN